MIPLSPSTGLAKFPRYSLIFLLVLLVLDMISRFWPGPRDSFLLYFAYNEKYAVIKIFSSVLFFPNTLSLIIHAFFFWSFAPQCFVKLGFLRTLIGAIGGIIFSIYSFYLIHPSFQNPILAPEALYATILGMSMRHELWGSTRTLVLGLGWMKVFDVPSYVLLFFYFFYLLLSNFFLPSFYQDAPMLYWIPFVGFLWGFLWALPQFDKVDQVTS